MNLELAIEDNEFTKRLYARRIVDDSILERIQCGACEVFWLQPTDVIDAQDEVVEHFEDWLPL